MSVVEARMTVGEALGGAARALEEAGIEAARVDAEWLLAEVLGVGRLALHLALHRELDPASASRYERALARRAAREPLQHILGWEAFCGLRLRVTPDVLVPRPETEALVEWALAWLPPPGLAVPLVVDVGTGSGCIACAVSHVRPDARVIALDVSDRALAVARDNVDRLGFAARVHLVAADVTSPIRPSTADLVVANLPYLPEAWLSTLPVEVRDHEPLVALLARGDGLSVIARAIQDARRCLRAGGALVMETAGEKQALEVVRALQDQGFVDVSTRADFAGVRRLVGAQLEVTDAGAA